MSSTEPSTDPYATLPPEAPAAAADTASADTASADTVPADATTTGAATPDGSGHPVAPTELVTRGLLLSLGAIPLGMAAAVLIWRLGFIASISSFVVSGAAVWLYTKGAGTMPKRGILPLVGVILVGVALSFLAIVANDIVDYYGSPEGAELGYSSVWGMLGANLFAPEVITSYGSDALMFLGFAALGVFGTMRQLAASRRG